MAEITEEQFAEWCAFAAIDGWSHGWMQTAALIAAIRNTGTLIVANPKDLPDMVSPQDVLDMIDGREPEKPAKGMTPEQYRMLMESTHG